MNNLEETRNGYLITAEMKRVWSIQLGITRHILDVCKRHGLKVWADWGTLLGAVREKGFSPWDDETALGDLRYEELYLCRWIFLFRISQSVYHEKYDRRHEYRLRGSGTFRR